MKVFNLQLTKYKKIKFLVNFFCIFLFCFEIKSNTPPEVEVNYLPKKQWKMSKHDMADIKLDIERELRAKILQMQMNWKNRQNMQEYMIQNQQYSQPQIIPPTLSFPYNNNPQPTIPFPFKTNNNPNPMSINRSLNNGNNKQDISRLENKLDTLIEKVTEKKISDFLTDSNKEINNMKRNMKVLYPQSSSNNNNSNDKKDEKYRFKSKENYDDDRYNNDNNDGNNNTNDNNLINKDIDVAKKNLRVINPTKEKNTLRSIVDRYKSNVADKELKVFDNIIKKYNSTVHNVDFGKINSDIKDYSDYVDKEYSIESNEDKNKVEENNLNKKKEVENNQRIKEYFLNK